MAKIIQMIKISENNSLWIIGYNEETKELTFKTSRNSEHLQIEKVIIKDNNVYTNFYFFNIEYLKNFLNEKRKTNT